MIFNMNDTKIYKLLQIIKNSSAGDYLKDQSPRFRHCLSITT